MKFNKKLYTMALGTIAFGGLLASCSNELNEPTFGPVDGNGSVNLVHTPDVYAWSGNEDLGNNTRSFGTRGRDDNANMWDNTPKDITSEEIAYVSNWFIQNENPKSLSLDLSSFYVQQVYIGKLDRNSYLAKDGSTYVNAWEKMDDFHCGYASNPDNEEGHMRINNDGQQTSLMINTSSQNFSYNNTNVSQRVADAFRIVKLRGSYYVGFTFKGDGGSFSNNFSNSQKVEGDLYFDDWIIKITPADKDYSDNIPDYDNPGGGDNGNDNPGTGENGGNGNNGGDNNGNVTIEDKRHYSEVEVNLSVNDVHINDGGGQKYDYADLWTKLSIHVRKGTDVKVVLPVPAKYMVESDDFAIFQKHELGGGVTSGDMAPNINAAQRIQSMKYNITDSESGQSWLVELSIAFTKDEPGYSNGCIIVSTTGIDKNLIDYLWKKNGDGINFEVWNYFQTDNLGSNQPVIGDDGLLYSSDLTHSRLQDILNGETEYGKSTIQFINEAPDFYINAFGFEWTASGLQGTHNSNINPWDCTVIPVDTVTFPSAEPYYSYHLNSTPWNIIWVNNNVEKKGAAYEAHVNYFYHPTEGYISVTFPW